MQYKWTGETRMDTKENCCSRIGQRVISALLCFTLLFSNFLLILPAAAAEDRLVCGKEEHIHTEECYVSLASVQEQQNASECVCADECVATTEEAAASETLICELEEHSHTEECQAAEETSERIPETVTTETTAETVPETIVESTPETIAESVPETVPESTPETVAEELSLEVSGENVTLMAEVEPVYYVEPKIIEGTQLQWAITIDEIVSIL